MFEFFNMLGTYEDRKVARYEDGDIVLSTAWVNDSDQPYETALSHPAYDGGRFIVLQVYDLKEEAEDGHAKWEEVVRNGQLPETLEDVGEADIAEFVRACGGLMIYQWDIEGS